MAHDEYEKMLDAMNEAELRRECFKLLRDNATLTSVIVDMQATHAAAIRALQVSRDGAREQRDKWMREEEQVNAELVQALAERDSLRNALREIRERLPKLIYGGMGEMVSRENREVVKDILSKRIPLTTPKAPLMTERLRIESRERLEELLHAWAEAHEEFRLEARHGHPSPRVRQRGENAFDALANADYSALCESTAPTPENEREVMPLAPVQSNERGTGVAKPPIAEAGDVAAPAAGSTHGSER